MDFKLFLFILKLIIVNAGIQHVPVTRTQYGALRLGSPFIKSETIGRNIGYEYQYGIHDSINGYTNQVHVSNGGVILNEPSYRSIPVSNLKTVLANTVTKVGDPNLTILKTEQPAAVSFAKNADNSDLNPLPKTTTPYYKNVDPALRLPVQHIALVEDTSHISPTFSNAPDAIISSLLVSGVSNIPPELFSQLSGSLGSNLLRTTEMENESVPPVKLYTEALIDSPEGRDEKIPVTDFFSVKYYKKK